MLKPEEYLINVIPLSEKHCRYPIQGKLAYATSENFLGRIVTGYTKEAWNICLMTRAVADALCQVQNYLNKNQLGLFIFDSFRPLRAVNDFAHWLKQEPANQYELTRKQIHYPHLEKKQLIQLGYLAKDISRHCYGYAIDLSLVDMSTNMLLDMGACFDFFDELSHTSATAKDIGEVAYANRQILSEAMQQFGFIPYKFEYWHFDYYRREVEEPIDMVIQVI